jgi:5-methylcytosine-specific restriction enzyme subunit McrC
MIELRLEEWGAYGPESMPQLADQQLGDAATRRLSADLSRMGYIEILELRNGLQIGTSSWVGNVRIGDLQITIQPKVSGMPLLRLLRYAYGLRDLKLFEVHPQDATTGAFQDLLIHQLVAETEEIIARGLHRRYTRESADLPSPRGRVDFLALAKQGGLIRAALPCSHYPRLQDVLVNRALLAGLNLASRLTTSAHLRSKVHRQATAIAETVSEVPLTAELLRQTRMKADRLTSSYGPALELARLLLEGQGTDLEHSVHSVAVPGFLFDMNRFFQVLLSRFLREGLPDCELQDEHSLKGMLSYDPRRNPLKRRAPSPRPDFIIKAGGRVEAMLDAKYRDLWSVSLPREMLYQLVIYASSKEADGRATILYPSYQDEAQEACVDVRSALTDHRTAEVVLRPFSMKKADLLISAPPSPQRDREHAAYARWLSFGEIEGRMPSRARSLRASCA